MTRPARAVAAGVVGVRLVRQTRGGRVNGGLDPSGFVVPELVRPVVIGEAIDPPGVVVAVGDTVQDLIAA